MFQSMLQASLPRLENLNFHVNLNSILNLKKLDAFINLELELKKL